MSYDVVVIGGGAAGLAAGMMLGRSRRRVLVADADRPRNGPSEHLHGFLSRDGASPSELLATGRDELSKYGGEFRAAQVTGIERTDDGFIVRADDAEVSSRCVLVATGLRDELPDVPGIRQQWGRGVLHCPYCHGYEVADEPIAVLGGDNRPFTMHQAQLIRQWSTDVTFFPHRITLSEDERVRLVARGVRIVEGKVSRVVADETSVSGIELDSGETFTCGAIFVGPRFIPRDDLLIELGCAQDDNGWVRTDPSGRTDIEGVWAAGNVVDNPAQLINAASAGSTAAIAINHYLLADDIDRAVAEHGAHAPA